MPAQKREHCDVDTHADHSYEHGQKKPGRPNHVRVSASRVKIQSMKDGMPTLKKKGEK